MPYVTKARPYKKEYAQQKERGEDGLRKDRRAARDLYDARGISRKGRDIDHKVPLSKGGSAGAANLRLTTPEKNRSFSRNADHTVKKNAPKSSRTR